MDSAPELNMTPQETVDALDRYIIGQTDAKKAVAVALRNRWRRLQLDEDLKDEILPKNIIMIGATGIGKTEIARRISKLVNAPFVKVEASKFTEVGYVGRDVESMIRDLTDYSVNMVRQEQMERKQEAAKEMVEERLLDLLLPPLESEKDASEGKASTNPTREKFRKKLRSGVLDERMVELDVSERPSGAVMEFMPVSMNDNMDMNIRDMLSNMMPKQSKRRRVNIEDARKILQQEEVSKLIDMDEVIREALTRVEQSGIVFLDEIDKVASRRSHSHGPDVSREGVQRDLLPIVEGSTVNTKHGPVQTDHILFIAAGAFHLTKPSDMIPELQGRFPIRVELQSLSKDDFVKILTEPKNALIVQYTALMKTEGVELEFTKAAIDTIAEIACQINEDSENIGARRLHTVMEQLLEEVSFTAPDLNGQKISVTPEYIQSRLSNLLKNQDLSRYIL
ncbi:MAG TPA: ATP-dependent protease ATPase subunit HslU [Candidatus Lambdaproteobacteria bacterium]|jgi:ATP-dependent HslUV protease ATP-binding subunit HslU|uniref:ATP-dependent protease ATPase subunit HslU n=2 Tax=root TaxID=1 RepID=A0A432GNJ7_9DELT|nr:ATP-dependent protease ATPase subunit HslU [SAR324 cluster bacterium]HBD28127.1 HslU--HslV peptidase ATPase subunit [Deltaproteobacteria bacterium]HHZ86612.1 ATP-dependent protease ATPase subunit HslU [Candidatus Lambdaproteobacteria bacterium]RTZ80186.1 MAG: HslU--HslV peptidase ATPase subunit [SAR324 cluster bacterium]RTZ85096.1 MAG: HslU--HslV peptidase ATPase subunit [SAR324 cluster bacterium]